jgi:Xaa-Pro aminopeptidase
VTKPQLPHVSDPEERARRYAALRAAMAEAGLDALVVAGRGDDFVRGRVQYVADVPLMAGHGYVVLPASGQASYVGDPLWGTRRVALCGWVTELRVSHHPGTEVGAILEDLGLARGRIGLVGTNDAAAAGHVRDLEAAVPHATIVDATDLFDGVRVVKSAAELERVRQTSTVITRVYDALTAEMRPGALDLDVLAEAHRLARQYGCVSGIALISLTPHDVGGFLAGTGATIQRGDTISVDLEWAGPSGYWLEHRRNWCFGTPSDECKRFWDATVDCFFACMDAIRPGASSYDIIAARDAAAQKHGYHASPGPGYTAHGLGLDCLEPPYVPGRDRTLQPGMVLSLHPHFRAATPGEESRVGGIGLADNILVTETGAEALTEPKPTLISL